MKGITLIIFSLFFSIILIAQNNLKSEIAYPPEVVLDKTYGITMYEPLNMRIGSDTVRNNKSGYTINGYKEDYYTTGKLLHKGFYLEGRLKVYKNYFPNGNVERNFRLVDIKRSKMTIFYKDGTIKSDIVYIQNQALKWSDYYPNGTLEFVEEYDKDFQYFIFKANYLEDGTPENTLELINKKKLVYVQSFYYLNGKLKEEGEMVYDKGVFDYKRIGLWKLFDENGIPTKEVKYANSIVLSEKNL